jgi:hypothetical protein
MSEGLTDEDLHKAIDRLARTPDGRILYLFLQRRLMGVPASSKSGALRTDHGERMFAAKLIGLMATGIAESGGASSSSGDGSTGSGDKPIVFAVPQPRRVAGTGRGIGRRITEQTRVPGYDRDE